MQVPIRKLSTAAAALAATFQVFTAGVAQAGLISGVIWLNQPNNVPYTQPTVPSVPPDATFLPQSFPYQSQSSNYTIGGFLNNPKFTYESPTFVSAGGDDISLSSAFIQLTGTLWVKTGTNVFLLNAPNTRMFFYVGEGSERYTEVGWGYFGWDNPGPPTAVPFQLDFTVTGAPVDLGMYEVTGQGYGEAPEPATWAMLILGVAMIGFAARRRNSGMALPA